MKYLIIGTGGVGGSIAGFLALAGHDVTCIVRGANLEAIREKGLHLKSDLKGDHYIKVNDKLAPESTASMQKDLERGHESEINGLLFDVIELAEKLDISVPTYREVAKKFE